MSNEYYTLKKAIEFLDIEKAQFIHYVANVDLHPCFLCDVVFTKTFYYVDEFTQEYVSGYFAMRGYITPKQNLAYSLNDETFYIVAAQLIANSTNKKGTSQSFSRPSSILFSNGEAGISREMDINEIYEISHESPNFIEGKGIELHMSQCMFLKSELDEVKDSLPQASTTPEHEKLKADSHSPTISDFELLIPDHKKLSQVELFKPAALYALAKLQIPCTNPIELKTNSGGFADIRSDVKKFFSEHAETARLVLKENTFNTYWDRLINGELDKYDQLIK